MKLKEFIHCTYVCHGCKPKEYGHFTNSSKIVFSLYASLYVFALIFSLSFMSDLFCVTFYGFYHLHHTWPLLLFVKKEEEGEEEISSGHSAVHI